MTNENETAMSQAKKLFVGNYHEIQALGGQVWKVFTVMHPAFTDMRDYIRTPEFLQWGSLSHKGYKTAAMALGVIKRMAKTNGGTGVWLVYAEPTWNKEQQNYTGPSVWTIKVGSEKDIESLRDISETISAPVRKALWGVQE